MYKNLLVIFKSIPKSNFNGFFLYLIRRTLNFSEKSLGTSHFVWSLPNQRFALFFKRRGGGKKFRELIKMFDDVQLIYDML